MPASLTLYTFEYFGADPTRVNSSTEAINNAIKWSADNGQPVYGGKGVYKLTNVGTSSQAKVLLLVSNAHIICLEGCVFQRDFGFDAATNRKVVVRQDGDFIERVVWVGWHFKTGVAQGGGYHNGDIFDLNGNEIALSAVKIEGYHGHAMALHGNQIRVFNPTITKPDMGLMVPAAGIRLTGGDGFRCYGGYIVSGNDAAMQFSTAEGSGRQLCT